MVKRLENLSVLISRLVPGVKKVSVLSDTLIISVKKSFLVNCLKVLKTHSSLKFASLMDIWGLDYPERKDRFEINYSLLSVKYNIRVIVRVTCEEFEGVDSVTSLYSSAGWLEREVWDMYGVLFYNNKDLRRILTDYGFEGHPLRKDFPLSGYTEVRYDDTEKRVVYEPIEVAQEYRSFNFRSPWEKL